MMQVFGIIVCILASNSLLVHGVTDQDDVTALKRMYQSLNSASQLTNWNLIGNDPCGQSWKGVFCSGSQVTSINLSGLGLTGSLDYWLSNLASVTRLDLSNNKLVGQLPYSLPPKIQELNLAGNSFSGNLPYLFNQMPSLQIINLSRNQFGGSLPDAFGALSDLSTLDLSSNKFTGELPGSFGSLTSINTMNLQNNQFTGHIDVIANLPLQNLNVANNRFTGWIPSQLKGIHNFQTSGNLWSDGPAPPPPPFTPPPARKSNPGGGSSNGRNSSSSGKSGIGGGGIAGIVISLLVVGAVVAFFLVKRKRRRSLYNEKPEKDLTFAPLTGNEANEMKFVQSTASVEVKALESTKPVNLKPPPFEPNKSFDDDDISSKNPVPVKKFDAIPVKKYDTSSISAIQYSVADLQIATRSFNVDNIIGEGPAGRVYRAKFDNGKILAVKKISSSAIQTPNTQNFLETVSNISHFRHPNISELVGYCSEHGQYLLVYQFYKNGSLHDFLHLSDGYNKNLTWSSRIKIALGTARALEYLHEVCAPSIIHKKFKSSKILLDGELNPYLSGSGMSNLLRKSEHEDTSAGYSAPEVDMSGQYTMKSDVYSFGVVMLELLTGREPFDSSRQRPEQSLVRWAYPQLHDIEALAKMVDPGLEGLYPPKSLSRLADVVALCVQPEPEFRPPMSEVVQALVRLVQRANMSKRTPTGDGSVRRGSDPDLDDTTL